MTTVIVAHSAKPSALSADDDAPLSFKSRRHHAGPTCRSWTRVWRDDGRPVFELDGRDGFPGRCRVEKPTGTVTFLFTDIEGSTRRWAADPDAMSVDLAAHDEPLFVGLP